LHIRKICSLIAGIDFGTAQDGDIILKFLSQNPDLFYIIHKAVKGNRIHLFCHVMIHNGDVSEPELNTCIDYLPWRIPAVRKSGVIM
jgi:hypothetical protein